MLLQKFTQPAQTEWAIPILFAPNKDGYLRFFVNHRKLNAVTIRASCQISRTNECIDSLGKMTVFYNLDANSEFWQVDVEKSDWDKMAFTSHHGLYCFVRKHFGLKNAHESFITRWISSWHVKWQFSVVDLDHIAEFFCSPCDRIEYVKRVLSLLRDAGGTVILKKCEFFRCTTDYFGHVLRTCRL